MTMLDVTVDEWTYETIKEMALERGMEVEDMAVGLLQSALHAAQTKHVYGMETRKAYAKEFEAEDLALADSGSAHRLELLEAEDRA